MSVLLEFSRGGQEVLAPIYAELDRQAGKYAELDFLPITLRTEVRQRVE
jgi:hypothetical protein